MICNVKKNIVSEFREVGIYMCVCIGVKRRHINKWRLDEWEINFSGSNW